MKESDERTRGLHIEVAKNSARWKMQTQITYMHHCTKNCIRSWSMEFEDIGYKSCNCIMIATTSSIMCIPRRTPRINAIKAARPSPWLVLKAGYIDHASNARTDCIFCSTRRTRSIIESITIVPVSWRKVPHILVLVTVVQVLQEGQLAHVRELGYKGIELRYYR